MSIHILGASNACSWKQQTLPLDLVSHSVLEAKNITLRSSVAFRHETPLFSSLLWLDSLPLISPFSAFTLGLQKHSCFWSPRGISDHNFCSVALRPNYFPQFNPLMYAFGCEVPKQPALHWIHYDFGMCSWLPLLDITRMQQLSIFLGLAGRKRNLITCF